MTFGIGSIISDQEMMKDYKPASPSKRDRKVINWITAFFKKKGIVQDYNAFYPIWTGEILEIKVINSAFSSIAQELADEIKKEFSIESKIWIKPEVRDPFEGTTPEEYFSH